MADLNTGPVDYTSRDYASIRDDVLAAVKARIPEWSGADDTSDYLRVLLEGFAFVGDITAYYVDRVANESFLPTASMRSTLLNISRTFGYSPAGPIAASLNLTLTNTGGTAVDVPIGSQFSGTYNRDGVQTVVTFESLEDATVAANEVVNIAASEGVTSYGSTAVQTNGDPVGVLLYRADGTGTSDGSADQQFLITGSPIIDGSVRVWVHPPTGGPSIADGVEYFFVPNIIDASAFDRVFTIFRNEDDSVNIAFGDGASGFIPASGYIVRATYRTGLGVGGNVNSSTINTVGKRPDGTLLPSSLLVSHVDPAVGGADSESNDLIRDKAFRVLRTHNRAVTLKDFEDLSVQSPGISRANAIGSAMSNVLVYVAPETESSRDDQPGYTTGTYTVTTATLAADLATVTTFDDHGLFIGEQVNISGTGYPFDGTWVVAETPSSNILTINMPSPISASGTGLTGTLTKVGDESATFTSIRSSLVQRLKEVVPMGTGLAVVGAKYTDLVVRLTLNLSGNVRQSSVKSLVTAALLEQFSVSTGEFAAQVFTSDVVKAAVTVSGVNSALVTVFDRSIEFSLAAAAAGASGFANVEDTLVAAPHEIFRLLPQNLVLSLNGGIADLS